MRANVMPGPRTAELNGLNWHVQVDPLSLSITSLPPTLPELAGVEEEPDDDVDVEFDVELPPPQAATSTDTMANRLSHLKRFMDTLSSVRRLPCPHLAKF